MQVSTFDQWKRDMDRTYKALLSCEVDKKNRSLVSSMFCKVCREYEDRILKDFFHQCGSMDHNIIIELIARWKSA